MSAVTEASSARSSSKEKAKVEKGSTPKEQSWVEEAVGSVGKRADDTPAKNSKGTRQTKTDQDRHKQATAHTSGGPSKHGGAKIRETPLSSSDNRKEGVWANSCKSPGCGDAAGKADKKSDTEEAVRGDEHEDAFESTSTSTSPKYSAANTGTGADETREKSATARTSLMNRDKDTTTDNGSKDNGSKSGSGVGELPSSSSSICTVPDEKPSPLALTPQLSEDSSVPAVTQQPLVMTKSVRGAEGGGC